MEDRYIFRKGLFNTYSVIDKKYNVTAVTITKESSIVVHVDYDILYILKKFMKTGETYQGFIRRKAEETEKKSLEEKL